MAANHRAKAQYVQSLQAGAIVFPRIVLGELEAQPLAFIAARRAAFGWPPHTHTYIEIRTSDVLHQLKRLGEGLTADEMWKLVECVLHPKATAVEGANGRTVLLYFEPIEFERGYPFTPQGVVMDALDWKAPRLYGLIPKGWRGRK